MFDESYRILNEYDKKMSKEENYDLCKEANNKIIEMLKKNTEDVLGKLLAVVSENMKTRYHRGDN